EEIGTVAAGSGYSAGIAGLVPVPGCPLSSGIVDQLSAGTGGSGVEPEHGFDSRGIFVSVGHDEEFGQLRSLVEPFDPRTKSLARTQDEELYGVGMETRVLYFIDTAQAASACQTNDIALSAGLRA